LHMLLAKRSENVPSPSQHELQAFFPPYLSRLDQKEYSTIASVATIHARHLHRILHHLSQVTEALVAGASEWTEPCGDSHAAYFSFHLPDGCSEALASLCVGAGFCSPMCPSAVFASPCLDAQHYVHWPGTLAQASQTHHSRPLLRSL